MEYKTLVAECSYCSSTNILFDSWKYWNVPQQRFVLHDGEAGGQPFCVYCDGETTVNWREIEVG